MREPDENVTCGASDLGEERGRPQRGVLVDRVHDDVLEVDAESLDVQVREGSLCALYIENLPVEHAEACGIQDLDNVRFELSTKRRPQWRRDDGRVTGLGTGGAGRAGRATVAAVAAAIHDTTRRNTCSPYRLPLSSEGPITEFKISAFELGLTFSQQFDN